jgi:hypothetical protein
MWSLDRAVGNSDWLQAGLPRVLISSPGRVKNFLRVVQTGSGIHATSFLCNGYRGKAAVALS